MRFKGKSVLVTGGAKGIGEAITRAFASEGARVFVNYNTSKAEAEKLAKEEGGFAVRADVSNSKQVEAMKKFVLGKTGGTLDVLVNNAGDIDWVSSWEDVTEKMWDRVVNTNLKGTFLCTRAFAPSMLKRKRGAIVNLSSTAFFQGKFPAVHYNASKAGAVAATLEKLVELGYFKTKSEAIRAGVLELGKEYNLLKTPQELEAELVIRKVEQIDREIDEGKRKTYPLDEVLRESRRRKK